MDYDSKIADTTWNGAELGEGVIDRQLYWKS